MRNTFILILNIIVLSFMACNHSRPKGKGDLIELKSLDKSPITKVDSIFLMDSCKLLICNKDTIQLLNPHKDYIFTFIKKENGYLGLGKYLPDDALSDTLPSSVKLDYLYKSKKSIYIILRYNGVKLYQFVY